MKSNIKQILSGLAAALLLTGCYDELEIQRNGDQLTEGNGTEGLAFYIPNVEAAAFYGATRADGFANPNALAESEEGKINSLWLCAFPTDGQSDNKLIKKITDNDLLSVSFNAEYKGYEVKELKNGSYNFYVFANIDDYLNSTYKGYFTNGTLTETNVKSLQLDFYGKDNLLPGNLPMVCLAENIKTGVANSTRVNSNAFKYEKGKSTLYADLTFLVTKIRYTFFFDNTAGGFSEPSFGIYPIDFYNSGATTSPKIYQVRRYTSLIYKSSDDFDPSMSSGEPSAPQYIGSSNWLVPLRRVEYPDGEKYSSVDEYPKYGDSYDGTGSVVDKTGDYDVSTSTTQVERNLETLPESTVWGAKDKRAWQGVMYVPENRANKLEGYDYSGRLDDTRDYRTYLNFKADFNGSTKDYRLNLLPEAYNPTSRAQEVQRTYKNAGPGIYRSTLYDLVGKITNSLTLSENIGFQVADWNLRTLTYELRGPVELNVDKTRIEVIAGEETPIVCTSNVLIDFTVPKFKNTDIDFYIIRRDETNNTYYVSVNPDLSFEDLKSLKDDPDNSHADDMDYVTYYKYFHVDAGNLHKKIEVEPLDLSAYLKVNPEEININVREYYVSGNYDGVRKIDFETNVDQGIVLEELSGYDAEDGLTYTTGLLSGIKGETNTTSTMIWLTGYTKGDQVGQIVVNFQGMNSGDSYWTKNHDYKLRIKVDNNDAGIQRDCPPVIVRIHVRPYVTSYVIHFKDNTKSWSYPHIYVYQCLELPKDLEGANAKYAGLTVGYDNSYNGNTDYLAALEYAFTNKLSFRGWKDYGGPSTNDPNASATLTNGFVILGNGSRYAPKNNNTDVYNYNIDFNNEHKANITKSGGYKCLACENDYINRTFGDHKEQNYQFRTWPGIQMEPEGDGWWKYTLTTVATPGKALIMFTDGHDHSMDTYQNQNSAVGIRGYRFPGNAEVGVPLFDYPDNEGWFLFDGDTTNHDQNFTDDKPVSNSYSDTKKIYRFLWPKSWGNGIFMNLLQGNNGNNTVSIAGWESGRGMSYNDNWYMMEFSLPTSFSGNIEYKIWEDRYGTRNPWGDQQDNINAGSLSLFTSGGDGYYYAYVNNITTSASMKGGKPTTTVTAPPTFTEGDNIVVTWYNKWDEKTFQHLYTYTLKKDNSENWLPWGKWPGYQNATQSGAYRTVTHSVTWSIGPTVYVMPNGNDPCRPKFRFDTYNANCVDSSGLSNAYGGRPRVTYNSTTRTWTIELNYGS